MLYSHYSEYQGAWRWPNFSLKELSCPHCGEYWHDPTSLDQLQRARAAANRPFTINSAHRCYFHNLKVGGTPSSQHKKIAFDISLRGHNKHELLDTLRAAGFTTFGYYQTFIHTDIRPNRRWYSGSLARELWRS